MVFDRVNNAKRNSIWGFINKIAGLLLPFILRTAIIYALGSEYLGLNSLFTSILSVLNLAELGVGNAIVFNMYKPIADNDYNTICGLLSVYKRVYRIIGAIILVVGLSIIPVLPRMIHSDLPAGINIYVLYLVYLINTVVTYWLFAYKTSLLHAYQRDDLISKNSILVTSFLYSTQICLVLFARSYYLYIFVIPVFTIVGNMINAHYANVLFPELQCRGDVEDAVKADIRKRVYGLSMIKVAAASRNALDSIIISLFIGLQTVAIYNNYYYIMNSIAGILMVFTSSIASIVGNSVAVEDKSHNLQSMRLLNYMYMSLSGLCAVLLLNIYQPFMHLWVGESLSFPNYIMILFVIYFFVSRLGDVQAQFFDAAGLWWHGRWRGVLEALTNLALNFLLGYYWGVRGILVATIISVVMVNFPLSVYYTFRYYYELSPKSFIIDQFTLWGFCCIAAICTYPLCSFVPSSHNVLGCVFFLCIRALLTTAMYLGLMLLLFRKTDLFNRARGFLESQLIKHKSAKQ